MWVSRVQRAPPHQELRGASRLGQAHDELGADLVRATHGGGGEGLQGVHGDGLVVDQVLEHRVVAVQNKFAAPKAKA